SLGRQRCRRKAKNRPNQHDFPNPRISGTEHFSARARGVAIRRYPSEREVIKMLRTCGGRPVVLQPLPSRYRDRADYWLSGTSARLRRPKKAIAALFRATDRLFGTVPSMNLDLTVRKEAEATAQR